jgi:predicted MFS family arabinose efflux permease
VDGEAGSSAVTPASATRATIALVLLRIAYAYNWFDIGPGFPALSATFQLDPTDWGILLAAFLGGAGLWQVPSGVLTRRYGTRTVSLTGSALLGVAALASAGAPSFDVLVGLRFAAGAGAGLFFSPAIALVGSLHAAGRRGVPVGIFSSAFSAGAGLGVFGSALLIPLIGWRGSLAFGGILLLAFLAVGWFLVPARAGRPIRDAPRRGLLAAGGVLRSRAVWAIGLAFVGLEGASLSAGQYFVPYAEQVRTWSPALAGAVGAVFVFPSFFGGPFGGRLVERNLHRRTQMVLVTAGPAVLLFLVPFVGLAGIVAIALVFSVGYGMVYAMMYVLAYYLPGVGSSEVPLAIGLFNGIQLAGGACVSFVTGEVIARWGYTLAWEGLAGMVLAPLALLAFLPRTGALPGGDVPREPIPQEPAGVAGSTR